jgi:hypothetical protein
MLWGLSVGSLVSIVILELANKQIGDPFKGPSWLQSFTGLCVIEIVCLVSSFKYLDFFARRFHHRHVPRTVLFTLSLVIFVLVVGWTIVFHHGIPPIDNLEAILGVITASGAICLYFIMLFVPLTAPVQEKVEHNPPPQRQEEQYKTSEQGELTENQKANYLADVEQRRWETRLWVAYGYTALLAVLFLDDLFYLLGAKMPIFWQLHREVFPTLISLAILLLVGGFAALLGMSVCTAYKNWYMKETPILLSPEGLLWIVYATPLTMFAFTLSSLEWYIILATTVLTSVGAFFIVKKILVEYYYPVTDEYTSLHGK